MVICDTSALLASIDGSDPRHEKVAPTLKQCRPPLIVSTLVLAELDYMLRKKVSLLQARFAMNQIIRPPFEVAQLSFPEISAAMEVDERYGKLNIGLTDASLVVLAEKHDTQEILTLDRKHFGAVKPLQGGSFTLLPETS